MSLQKQNAWIKRDSQTVLLGNTAYTTASDGGFSSKLFERTYATIDFHAVRASVCTLMPMYLSNFDQKGIAADKP